MNLITELRAIQHRCGFLPEEELRAFAQRTSTPLYQIQAVASFYPHFRRTPPPAVEVRVCADLSCHLCGSAQLKKVAERELSRLGFHQEEVGVISCLGQCDRSPAVAINDLIYPAANEERLRELIRAAHQGKLVVPTTPQTTSRTSTLDPYAEEKERFSALRQLVAAPDFGKVIQTLKDSGLRGMGGAGFPAGLKWEIVRNAPGQEKYVVVNADESEPGTFKDRFLLEKFPHLLIEGALLGALVVGAHKVYIFIRHEYPQQKRVLEEALTAARASGLIGERILGSNFSCEVEVFESAGGYICGEETALLEALEGKRAEPRNKPPFPGTYGLWGQPTLINNVETLCFVPAILLRGAEWFKSQGRNGGGLKHLALSGHVQRPGVYEVPLGLSAREFISEYGQGLTGNRSLKAFSPGGASSGFLPASMADIALDFQSLAQAGSMLGSGAVVALAESTCMLDVALNVVNFFRNESCGKCVPCRVGSEKIVQILEQATRGQAGSKEIDLIGELAETMQLTSICGLGQAAPLPITSALKYFPDEIMAHLTQKQCPEGVCFR
jgi:NADH:ubiquinone oxidoreductase subunit F (NADH-binding)/NADH:ubiquinone oxidoreductase subunit E